VTSVLRGISRYAASVVDRDEFDRWLDESSQALRSARVQQEAHLHNWACFMSEQSAHLAVKALLHGLGLGLVALGARAREACGELWPHELEPLLRSLSVTTSRLGVRTPTRPARRLRTTDPKTPPAPSPPPSA
jgi:hypothetical protein